MNDIEILQEMLVPEARVELQQQGKPSVKLTDSQGKTTVLVKGLPNETIVIRAEKFGPHDDVLKGAKGENKRADFVILTNEKTQKWIICIETQGGKSKNASDVVNQLKGAQCFIYYCKCLGKSFWNSEEFLDGYRYRFVSMTKIYVNKKKTRYPWIQPKQELHETPEKFLNNSRSPSLHFKKLIQKTS